MSRANRLALAGVVCLLFSLPLAAQQIAIPRVESMPDLPSPYVMRDWKQVARDYDAFVFDWTTDRFYPTLVFSSTSSNLPALDGFGLQSYVGQNLATGEGINVIPAVVGASLVGIDKSAQDRNYVEQCQHWFNSANGLDLYLNGPSSTTGGDWWYETMPNVFFFQLADLYPGVGEFETQVVEVADRLVEEVDALGGSTTPWVSPSYDYRAFNFTTMSPVSAGVHEPEAAGPIAWLLYSAYRQTGDERYRIGAELSMDFLQSWSDNPSYEIQMPYGVLTAARMNAELKTGYNVEKMVNWVFEMSDVRNWGVVVGTWGGYDVSGLVGEVDSDGYAFMMNGYQTASAMVPMVRYDDRFAHAIGKWVLNLANASRLYYTPFLPDTLQDGEWWTHDYDTLGVMGHEAIRQDFFAEGRNNEIYATGDASYGDWAPTNFALYGASHVGYLGAIVDTTDVSGVLQLDARATDFYQDDAYPSWLVYNPHGTQESVTVALAGSGVDLWDAVGNQTVASSVSGTASVDIPADGAMLLVEVPGDAIVTSENGVMYANGVVVDYNDGSAVANRAPRIRSLSALHSSVSKSASTTLYGTVVDPDGDTPVYNWSVDIGELTGSGASVIYTAPDSVDTAAVQLIVTDAGALADTAEVTIIITPSQPPVIQGFVLIPPNPMPGESVMVICDASDPDGDTLSYAWSASGGAFTELGDTALWTAPSAEGVVQIGCTVSDPYGLEATGETTVIVGDLVLHLEFNGDATDSSPFANDGTMVGGSYVEDRHGTPDAALHLTGPDSRVTVPVNESLNGQAEISVIFWLKPDHIPAQDEYYLVSHGSWQNRWKFTLGSDSKVKWTVANAAGSVKDIASISNLSTDLVNVAGTYNGKKLRIFINGTNEGELSYTGEIRQTDYDLLVGQQLPGQTGYNYVGVIDEVRVYNRVLSGAEISALIDIDLAVGGVTVDLPTQFSIASTWPNPFNGRVTVRLSVPVTGNVRLELFNLLGQRVSVNSMPEVAAGWRTVSLDLSGLASGTYLLRARMGDWSSEARRITLVR